MQTPNVITPSAAAAEKGCTTQAIRNAARRGELTAIRMGARVLIMRDKKYQAYQVRETGGRLHRSYTAGSGGRDKQEASQ